MIHPCYYDLETVTFSDSVARAISGMGNSTIILNNYIARHSSLVLHIHPVMEERIITRNVRFNIILQVVEEPFLCKIFVCRVFSSPFVVIGTVVFAENMAYFGRQ